MPYKTGTSWKAQVRLNGKKREKRFRTKKEAMEWELEMRTKIENGWSEETATVCLGDWAAAYLDFAKVKFSDKTYDEKRSMFRLFFKKIDPALNVTELTPSMVLKYVIDQKKNRSGFSANKDRKNLVAAWNWGTKYMDPSLPRLNPCLVEKMPEIRSPRYVPPEEDFWKVYDVAQEQDKVMLLAFLHLAARRGEIFQLTWEDVDFINNRVRLKTRKRKDGTLEFDWLPMTGDLRKAFRWLWQERKIKDSPYVFLCLDDNQFSLEHYGKPFKHRQKFMQKICKKAGIQHFGFHAIRHLSASTLYRLGHDSAIIQAVLRHKLPTTTNRYLKSLGCEDMRDALEDFSVNAGRVIDFPNKNINAEDKETAIKIKAANGAASDVF
jgi:integrase